MIHFQYDPDKTLDDIERETILAALAHHKGNKSKTARALGIALKCLYDKLHRYDYFKLHSLQVKNQLRKGPRHVE